MSSHGAIGPGLSVETKHMNSQLALNIPANEQKSIDNFLWDNNLFLKQTIEKTLIHQEEKFIYLAGKEGSGKSHLLQGLCQKFSPESSVYLPLGILKDWSIESIQGMEKLDFIAIDDIEEIAGDCLWEEAIFHLFNQIRDKNKSLLFISSINPPANLPIQLPDLLSRLSSGLIIPIQSLTDPEKIQVLQTQAAVRGFELPQTVGQFLLNHCGRNLKDLSHILDTLDNASLAAQRKITIPFVKAILGL